MRGLENDLGARKVKHRSAAADDPVLDDLRRALRAHPVHGLPDREERVRVAERWLRAVREADGAAAGRWPSGPAR